jgi:hypothetical protein
MLPSLRCCPVVSKLIHIDPAAAVYSVLDSSEKLEDSYAITGLDQLRQGQSSFPLIIYKRESIMDHR